MSVDRVGDLPEHPVGQAAIDAVESFESLDNLDTEGVTHKVRAGSPQPGVRVVDQLEIRQYACAHRVFGKSGRHGFHCIERMFDSRR